MTDRNIVDLARRVLGADKVGRDLNNAASWDAIELVLENAPALARAVIAVADLADAYEAAARLERREGDVTESINTQATSDRIRAALAGAKGGD